MITTDLQPIVARRAALEPGVWTARHRDTDSDILEAERIARGGELGSSVVSSAHPGSLVACSGWPNYNARADAEFIAHAPADIAALIDEVRALRAIVERVAAEVDPAEWGNNGRDEQHVVKAARIRAALVDQCTHDDGDPECWHFGERDGRDG